MNAQVMPLRQCGTISGASTHSKRGERPCEACYYAQSEYRWERRHPDRIGQYVPRPRTPPDCGTMRGYTRHVRRKEDPCRACKDAQNAYRKETPFYRMRYLTRRQEQPAATPTRLSPRELEQLPPLGWLYARLAELSDGQQLTDILGLPTVRLAEHVL